MVKFLDHLLPLDGVENADAWWRDFYQVVPRLGPSPGPADPNRYGGLPLYPQVVLCLCWVRGSLLSRGIGAFRCEWEAGSWMGLLYASAAHGRSSSACEAAVASC